MHNLCLELKFLSDQAGLKTKKFTPILPESALESCMLHSLKVHEPTAGVIPVICGTPLSSMVPA